MDMPLALLNRRRRGSVLNPAILFSVPGSRGFFYDFSDYSTQFTDTAGTTPVTGVGQSLALVLDESQGLALGPNIATVTSITGVPIGGPAFTNYQIAPAMVVGRAYEIIITVSGYSGSGTVGITDNVGRFEPDLTSSNIGGNGTIRVIGIAGSADVIQVFTRSTNTANFDNISVRELPGNHATQATAGSRPLTTTIGTGYRGVQFDGVDDFLQTAAIDFAGAESLGPELVTNGTFASNITGWSNSSDAGGTIAWNPLGYLDLINTTGAARAQQDFAVTSGRTYKFVVSNPGANTVDVYAGSTSGGINLLSATLTAGQTGTYIITATSSLMSLGFRNFGAGTTDSVDNVSVKEVLIAADKMTVVAGVRKLSDAARGMVVELGPGGANSFYLAAPNFVGANYALTSGGSNANAGVSNISGTAPDTSVLAGLCDISADTATIRRNGVAGTTGTADQGTGNFSNNIVYVGRRGGTTLPFNGILTFLCVINRTLTAAELAQLEAFANSRTGAY